MNDNDVESQSVPELPVLLPVLAKPIHEKDSVEVAIKATMTLKIFIFYFVVCLY